MKKANLTIVFVLFLSHSPVFCQGNVKQRPTVTFMEYLSAIKNFSCWNPHHMEILRNGCPNPVLDATVQGGLVPETNFREYKIKKAYSLFESYMIHLSDKQINFKLIK